MFNVKGSDFKQWYESLNENEKNIYNQYFLFLQR